MFHGNGQSGAVFQQTPDGRPGWAHYLMNQGYVVYMVDYPARGRSPYVPGHDGDLTSARRHSSQQSGRLRRPLAATFRRRRSTQWPSDHPKKGMMGDPVFDNFIKGQMQFVNNQAALAVPAGIALLDRIGQPVILMTHSQGGGIGFDVADNGRSSSPAWWRLNPAVRRSATWIPRRSRTRASTQSWGLTTTPFSSIPPISSPSELKVHLEPSERPGQEVGCYLQDEPARKLVNFQNMRILSFSAEGTYHRVFDACIPKWLNEAGAKADFFRLEDLGMRGNHHRCSWTGTATRSSSSSTGGCRRTSANRHPIAKEDS